MSGFSVWLLAKELAMHNKIRSRVASRILILLVLLPQMVSAYVFPGPEERIHDLGEWHWLFYVIGAAALFLGVASIVTRGKSYGKWGIALGALATSLSLSLGLFLTFVGMVKIPLSTRFVFGSSWPGGTRAVKDILYAPALAPLGISLLMFAVVLIIVGAYRNTKKQKAARAEAL